MENDFHPNCYACGSKNGAGLQLKFHQDEAGSVFGEFLADKKFESYSGIVHGGIIATLGMACILFGVEQKQLLHELDEIEN